MTVLTKLDPNVHHLLRHLVAAIAYRSSGVLKETPEGYAELSIGHDVRAPREILSHMTNVLAYVLGKLRNEERKRHPLLAWAEEVERFYAMLGWLDDALAAGPSLEAGEAERLLQGPLADTLTHIGQLATLRRMAGAPVPGRNYIKAKVVVGCVGIDQDIGEANV